MNRWSPLPTKSNNNHFDNYDDDDDFDFDESRSLMASHSSLPPSTNPNHSFNIKKSPKTVNRAKDKQVKRVIKELIDDEVPLIKI